MTEPDGTVKLELDFGNCRDPECNCCHQPALTMTVVGGRDDGAKLIAFLDARSSMEIGRALIELSFEIRRKS